MTAKHKFSSLVAEHLPVLEQYVPIVSRVHGGSHPEFRQVEELFLELSQKIAKDASPAGLEAVFVKLRAITSNYLVPGDVCESYAAVYDMLAQLDGAFQAGT